MTRAPLKCRAANQGSHALGAGLSGCGCKLQPLGPFMASLRYATACPLSEPLCAGSVASAAMRVHGRAELNAAPTVSRLEQSPGVPCS